ncbi:DUF3822 family protein [Adhaeribacter radiodurans]|uniref:DUF3822 family protein n=1 Tax=Adhaeribacter radiodurans TaxID=2745197 RepID=A0A7L7L6P4_9BACT|nr:DUF3822 family protein [Adhaeribacter radiodurans]QMU28512.1 DUF3822 family protein [Adhaeribacter radiodurans]
MTTTSYNYQLQTQIIDESFAVINADLYNLYIAASKNSFRFGIEDTIRHKFVALEDYALTNVFTPLQLVQQLRTLITEHAFYSTVKWHQIRIGIKNQKFTFLPGTLFDAKAATTYLKLHAELDEINDRVLSYHHPGTDMVNIFATEHFLGSLLYELFSPQKTQICHQTSALIETLLHITERTAQSKIYAYVEQNYLTLILLKDGNLEFCNVFYYLSPEDFIYFVVFVMQEHKLNPDQDPLQVWGDILHDSDLFDILRKYVRHVQLGKRPTGLSYSYKFEEKFEHRYFELFALHFCE